MLNYDADKPADFNDATLVQARGLGLHPIHVICKGEDDEPGDFTGVTFMAFVGFVPRAGEIIRLQDDTRCQVLGITFKVSHNPINPDMVLLIPNVYAKQLAAAE